MGAASKSVPDRGRGRDMVDSDRIDNLIAAVPPPWRPPSSRKSPVVAPTRFKVAIDRPVRSYCQRNATGLAISNESRRSLAESNWPRRKSDTENCSGNADIALPNPLKYLGKERIGWGTWIRTRTNGVRVRGSTVNLFPKTAWAMPSL